MSLSALLFANEGSRSVFISATMDRHTYIFHQYACIYVRMYPYSLAHKLDKEH